VKNVGRPLVGLQGNIIKNHHFRNGKPQGFSIFFFVCIVGFFILTTLETHKGPPYIFYITALLATDIIEFIQFLEIVNKKGWPLGPSQHSPIEI